MVARQRVSHSLYAWSLSPLLHYLELILFDKLACLPSRAHHRTRERTREMRERENLYSQRAWKHFSLAHVVLEHHWKREIITNLIIVQLVSRLGFMKTSALDLSFNLFPIAPKINDAKMRVRISVKETLLGIWTSFSIFSISDVNWLRTRRLHFAISMCQQVK